MSSYSNMLTIKGEEQNVGKTLFACNIIAKFSRDHEITGLKITPHKHKDTADAVLVFHQGNSVLMEETNPKSTKDTGRMLSAGARKAYLLQTFDTELPGVLPLFFKLIGNSSLIVCESGMPAALNQAAIRFFVQKVNSKMRDMQSKITGVDIDIIVNSTLNGFDFNLSELEIENNIWNLKK